MNWPYIIKINTFVFFIFLYLAMVFKLLNSEVNLNIYQLLRYSFKMFWITIFTLIFPIVPLALVLKENHFRQIVKHNRKSKLYWFLKFWGIFIFDYYDFIEFIVTSIKSNETERKKYLCNVKFKNPITFKSLTNDLLDDFFKTSCC